MDTPAHKRLGTTVLGRFRLVGLLASGGQADVYLARTPQEEQHAVKIARPAQVGGAKRLRREAALLARVRSPHVVRLVEAGDDPESGEFCLVEALVPGVPLTRFLERGEALQPTAALAVVSQVAAALTAIHAAGHAMRDLAPGQVMVTQRENGIQATVVDLGLTRSFAAQTRLTDPAAMAGTPGFTAPELLHDVQPDARTDVYALAALAFVLLTGSTPFAGPSPEATLALQSAGVLERFWPATPLSAGAHVRMRRLLTTALAPEPERRPESPAAFAHAFAAALKVRSAGRLLLWVLLGGGLALAVWLLVHTIA